MLAPSRRVAGFVSSILVISVSILLSFLTSTRLALSTFFAAFRSYSGCFFPLDFPLNSCSSAFTLGFNPTQDACSLATPFNHAHSFSPSWFQSYSGCLLPRDAGGGVIVWYV